MGLMCHQSSMNTSNLIALKNVAYNSIKNTLGICLNLKVKGNFNTIKIDQAITSSVTFSVANGVTTAIKNFDKSDIASIIAALASNTDEEGGTNPLEIVFIVVGAVVGLIVLIVVILVIVKLAKKANAVAKKKAQELKNQVGGIEMTELTGKSNSDLAKNIIGETGLGEGATNPNVESNSGLINNLKNLANV